MSLRVRTYTCDASECAFADTWDIAIHGTPVDSRGQLAVDWVQAHSGATWPCVYDAENLRRLQVDGTCQTGRDLQRRLQGQRVVLETTTLDLVELLELLRACRQGGITQIDLLYAEPSSYQREMVALDAPWTREFTLSMNRRFEGVPGFVTNLGEVSDHSRLVMFLGYEGARLAQACEQVDRLPRWTKYAVFGIPGYAPGWEMNALAGNVGTLHALQQKLSVRYCGAASVSGALALLEKIHPGPTGDDTTIVAPFGTKPHSIATALFLVWHCEYQESTLIWDHPTRSPNRSEQARRWHLYRVRF